MQLNNKKIHDLKCWPEFFLPLKERTKEFELRKNDRDFTVGDYLLIREFDPSMLDDCGDYTGRKTYRQVREILTADRAPDGLKEGYVILGLTIVTQREEEEIDTAIWLYRNHQLAEQFAAEVP